MTRRPGAGADPGTGSPSRNPLRSEDAAFRVLLWVAGIALVIIAVVLLARAL